MGTKNIIDMDGRWVYRFATNAGIASSIQDVLKKCELTADDIALIIPIRPTRVSSRRRPESSLPMEKFYMNVEHNGNTSAASIPLALVRRC